MRIYFENYRYPDRATIAPYFTDKETDKLVVPVQYDTKENGWYIEHIGYLFISSSAYSGPIFVLPKSFLKPESDAKGAKDTVLGFKGIYPELVIDTESEENPLTAQGKEEFLPELSLWLFRAMTRYREDCNKEKDYDSLNDLNYLTPNDSAQDRDFLSTAVRLMDFLSDHRNLFTQISKINNSGRSSIDWHKTIQQDAFVHKGKPFYLDLQIKNKAINIDEELIVLYYSVLRYLKEKYHFRIVLGDVPYDMKRPSEIQRYLDTGVGKRRMRDMKGKYFRDDLRSLWDMLDAFFTFNTSRDDKNPIREALVVKNFELVFEKMVDHLIGDTGEVADLKKLKDGKFIDHIYLDKSLIGKDSNIYYIGDSKYYETDKHPEGVAFYKQFTYARNIIQYNIDHYYIHSHRNLNSVRYRDKETEGYNITPNFFIVPKIDKEQMNYDMPSFAHTDWIPETSKHFEDRLFDRDTLILREYSINLLFLIAAYGAYEDWSKPLRSEIRTDLINYVKSLYKFFEVVPEPIPLYAGDKKVGEIPFLNYHYNRLRGKVYKVNDKAKSLIIAFEREGDYGPVDYEDVKENIATSISGGSIEQEMPLEP